MRVSAPAHTPQNAKPIEFEVMETHHHITVYEHWCNNNKNPQPYLVAVAVAVANKL